MAKSLNKIQLIGYIGKDPELKQTPKGKNYAEFPLVTTDGTGDYAHANWHQIVLWGKNADAAVKYLVKGARVYVEGVLDYYEYTKGNAKHRGVKITGFQVIYLSGGTKPEGGEETEAPW